MAAMVICFMVSPWGDASYITILGFVGCLSLNYGTVNKPDRWTSQWTSLVSEPTGERAWSVNQPVNEPGQWTSQWTSLVSEPAGQQAWSVNQPVNKLGLWDKRLPFVVIIGVCNAVAILSWECTMFSSDNQLFIPWDNSLYSQESNIEVI